MSLAICTLLAFHRRSTILAAYCVFYFFGMALCDTHGFYLFHDAIMALRSDEDYSTADIVYTHIYVACGIVGALATRVLIARSVASARKCE
ncbi:membrane protein [Rhodopirellula sallentina SM41]|uniref:Membrane protein n=1 Tax=Rhodopirellula sallentina SM41 TaxID=1263870 RepID=M5U0Y7_9BACT|nr:membrane protein [Rhodopirellula sallentina SM41]